MRSLRFDAGSRDLNLIATLGRRGGDPVERLDSPGALVQWLATSGLTPRGSDQELVREVRLLREAMYECLEALIDARPASAEATALISAYAARPLPAPRLETRAEGVKPDWFGHREGSDLILTLLAHEFLHHVDDPGWVSQLRRCEADDCRMLYLDRSGRRTWCSMQRCGNRAKAARRRAQQAGPERTGSSRN